MISKGMVHLEPILGHPWDPLGASGYRDTRNVTYNP